MDSELRLPETDIGEHKLLTIDTGMTLLYRLDDVNSYVQEAIDKMDKNQGKLAIELRTNKVDSRIIEILVAAYKRLGAGKLEFICEDEAVNYMIEECSISRIIRCYSSEDDFKKIIITNRCILNEL